MSTIIAISHWNRFRTNKLFCFCQRLKNIPKTINFEKRKDFAEIGFRGFSWEAFDSRASRVDEWVVVLFVLIDHVMGLLWHRPLVRLDFVRSGCLRSWSHRKIRRRPTLFIKQW